MKLITYHKQGAARVGRVDEDGNIYDAIAISDMQELIARAAKGKAAEFESSPSALLSEVSLLAPLPRPRRNIWCVGRNYRAHAKELADSVFKGNNSDPAAWPIVFTKVPECVIPSLADVILPGDDISTQIDYEAELAVVIGRGGKNIHKDAAAQHIFGFTIVNDVTARDVQMRHQQWVMGKSFDTFCPMGPWIVTPDSFQADDTRIRCWVNGELRQDARTTDMIFDIPTLIETISRGIELFPGDIIATGTAEGVGFGMKPPRYLGDGDEVEIEVDNLGKLKNSFVAARR